MGVRNTDTGAVHGFGLRGDLTNDQVNYLFYPEQKLRGTCADLVKRLSRNEKSRRSRSRMPSSSSIAILNEVLPCWPYSI